MLIPVVTVHTPSKVACGREYQGGIGQTPSSSASPRRLQLLGVIFGLLRITPSPLLISLTVHRGLVACEL